MATVLGANQYGKAESRVVRIVPGCTKDGRNAQILSTEIANLLRTTPAQIATPAPSKKK